MHTAELEFVKALAEATERSLIRWEAVPHDDREISRAEIDGDIVEVEFMYFSPGVNRSAFFLYLYLTDDI